MNKRVLALSLIALFLLFVYMRDSSVDDTPNYLQIMAGLAMKSQEDNLQKIAYEYKRLLNKKEKLEQYGDFVNKYRKYFYFLDNVVIGKVQSDIRDIFSKAQLDVSLGVTSKQKKMKGYNSLYYFDTRVEVRQLTIDTLAQFLKLLEKKRPHLNLQTLDIRNIDKLHEKIRFKAIVRAYAIGSVNER